MPKKIRWTYDLIKTLTPKQIKELPDFEKRRAIDFAYHNLNKRIDQLIKIEKEGYDVESIKSKKGYIKKFKPSRELDSKKKIEVELLRMNQFLINPTSSKEGVDKTTNKRVEQTKKILKRGRYSSDLLNRVSTKTLSRIWKVFRLYNEINPSWYNEGKLGQITLAYQLGAFKDVDWEDNNSIAGVINKFLNHSNVEYEMKLDKLYDKYSTGTKFSTLSKEWSGFINGLSKT